MYRIELNLKKILFNNRKKSLNGLDECVSTIPSNSGVYEVISDDSNQEIAFFSDKYFYTQSIIVEDEKLRLTIVFKNKIIDSGNVTKYHFNNFIDKYSIINAEDFSLSEIGCNLSGDVKFTVLKEKCSLVYSALVEELNKEGEMIACLKSDSSAYIYDDEEGDFDGPLELKSIKSIYFRF